MPGPSLTVGFGIFPYTRFRDAGELVETVVIGERLGFDLVSMPEHLLTPRWPTAPLHTKYWHDQLTLASFLAARTERLLFLTSVLVVPYHPPVQLAKALATVDVLSGGRIRLGVGAGWMKAEFRRLGIPYDERGAITDEYLAAMRELWRAEEPAYSGSHVTLEDVSFLPKPLTPGGVPIYIGGSGPRPFRRVAELGDGWLPMAAGAAEVRAGRAALEPLLAQRGRSLDELWVGCGFRAAADPEAEALVAHASARGGEGAGEPTASLGRAGRLSAQACIEGIAELAAAGVTSVQIAVGWRDATELREQLEWLAAEVLPAVR